MRHSVRFRVCILLGLAAITVALMSVASLISHGSLEPLFTAKGAFWLLYAAFPMACYLFHW